MLTRRLFMGSLMTAPVMPLYYVYIHDPEPLWWETVMSAAEIDFFEPKAALGEKPKCLLDAH